MQKLSKMVKNPTISENLKKSQKSLFFKKSINLKNIYFCRKKNCYALRFAKGLSTSRLLDPVNLCAQLLKLMT